MTPTTQPAEHTKLLPCPFCGVQPVTDFHFNPGYAKCVHGHTGWLRVEAWNRRAAIPAPESAIEQAREALRIIVRELECPCRNTTSTSYRRDGSVIMSGDARRMAKEAFAALSNLTPATDKQG